MDKRGTGWVTETVEIVPAAGGLVIIIEVASFYEHWKELSTRQCSAASASLQNDHREHCDPQDRLCP